MSILSNLRPSRSVADTLTETTTPAADQAVMRFLTLGGAEVVVMPCPSESYPFTWTCLGCDADGGRFLRWLSDARDTANEHAGECRAMPKPEAAR